MAPHFFAGEDMRVLLAPMEGVLDSLVRELLTEVNDYDLCITEFVRVVDQLLPVKVFHRICPELQNASRTPSGTLVRVQLLGQFPQWLAENAARPPGLHNAYVWYLHPYVLEHPPQDRYHLFPDKVWCHMYYEAYEE